jgi:hypothetical protein
MITSLDPIYLHSVLQRMERKLSHVIAQLEEGRPVSAALRAEELRADLRREISEIESTLDGDDTHENG